MNFLIVPLKYFTQGNKMFDKFDLEKN